MMKKHNFFSEVKKLSVKTPLKISPFERNAVYASLRSFSVDHHIYFQRLSIITANHSMTVWKRDYPLIENPLEFLSTANKVLLKEIEIENGRSIAQQGWAWLEKFGAGSFQEQGSSSFFAASAAWQALMEVTGKDPFVGIEITEKTEDDDLDPWSSDSTKWASYAYVHDFGPKSNASEKFANFYSWWLNIAIPKALDLNQSDLFA